MRLTRTSGLLIALTALAAASGCAGTRASLSGAIALPNFRKVDDGLYRGGQPNADGFRQLARMGITTVVSLRAYGHTARQEQDERRIVESLGMRWVSLPMRMYWRPTDGQVDAFLAITRAPGATFIHCQHGEDRTGSLVAVYRVARHGWTPEQAYAEAVELGMAGWNPFTRNLIGSIEPSAVTASARDAY